MSNTEKEKAAATLRRLTRQATVTNALALLNSYLRKATLGFNDLEAALDGLDPEDNLGHRADIAAARRHVRDARAALIGVKTK